VALEDCQIIFDVQCAMAKHFFLLTSVRQGGPRRREGEPEAGHIGEAAEEIDCSGRSLVGLLLQSVAGVGGECAGQGARDLHAGHGGVECEGKSNGRGQVRCLGVGRGERDQPDAVVSVAAEKVTELEMAPPTTPKPLLVLRE